MPADALMYRFQERILRFDPALLEAWKKGDKSMVSDGVYVPDDVINQPEYHFAEYFVLSHYMKRRWSGTCWFAIGDWEPGNPKYDLGRTIVRDLFGGRGLEQLVELRRGINKGEPDVLLYNDGGDALFLEVKKGNDTVSPEQLTCLAQIKALLQAEVGVAFLNPQGRSRTPKVYELDLGNFSGGELHGPA